MLPLVTAVSVVLVVSFLCSIFESVLLSDAHPPVDTDFYQSQGLNVSSRRKHSFPYCQ